MAVKPGLVLGGFGGGLLTVVLLPVIGLFLWGQTAVLALSDNGDSVTPGYSNLSVAPGEWVHPLGGPSPWTTYALGVHAQGAVDFPVGAGTPVFAPSNGVVLDLSESCGGKMLGVKHSDGTVTVFAHLSRFIAAPGQAIRSGELLALTGASGSCVNGAHLHMEVRQREQWGSFLRAYQYMAERGVDLGLCQSTRSTCALAH